MTCFPLLRAPDRRRPSDAAQGGEGSEVIWDQDGTIVTSTIVTIGGSPVATVERLLAELRNINPGERVELNREERTLDVDVAVGDRP